MAKAKRKPKTTKARPVPSAELPTPEQLANDDYVDDFVMHTETFTKARAYRKRDADILSRWMREGSLGFDEGACRAILSCQQLWERMGAQRVAANYEPPTARSTGGDGWTAHEAADEMARRRRMFPPHYFDVFENVVRHGEPAGVAGSRHAKNAPQAMQAAKTITGLVASVLAMKLGL